jgi:hypothetical protein
MRSLIAFILAALQLLAVLLFLAVFLGGIRGAMGAPRWGSAVALSICAASAAVCGYGCFLTIKSRGVTIFGALCSTYAVAAIGYFWSVVLPSFHG